MNPVKIGKSCDACKDRKVRCTKRNETDSICIHCQRRNTACHFSAHKRRARRLESSSRASQSSSLEVQESPEGASSVQETLWPKYTPPSYRDQAKGMTLYIDHLIEDRTVTDRKVSEGIFRASNHHIVSSNIAFFSERRLLALNQRLGHDKVKDLLEKIESTVGEKIEAMDFVASCFNAKPTLESCMQESDSSRKAYVESYFEYLHPLYPFLDQDVFVQRAFGPQAEPLLAQDPAWAALYYAVLAIGCQYHGEGTFTPGKGKAWNFFKAAVSLIPKFTFQKATLFHTQAMTAMTIFSRNYLGMPIDDWLINETARAARELVFYHVSLSKAGAETVSRTFWVVYCLEKEICFTDGRPSTIADEDIGCAVPKSPEPHFGHFDWLVTYARLARILTKTYASLFSVSATLQSREEYYQAIDSRRAELEQWKASLPQEFQPEHPIPASHKSTLGSLQIALRIRLSYYNLVAVLSRLTIHVGSGERQAKSLDTLVSTARSIVDLSIHINQESYMPTWMLSSMPLAALFILFDFTVHNPTHPDTSLNLKLLDIASGYFSRLDLASGGAFPCGMLAEFTHIARQHVHSAQSEKPQAQVSTPNTDMSPAHWGDWRPHLGMNDPRVLEQQHGPNGINQVAMPDQSFLGAGFIGIDNLGSGLDLMGLFGPFTTAAPLIP